METTVLQVVVILLVHQDVVLVVVDVEEVVALVVVDVGVVLVLVMDVLALAKVLQIPVVVDAKEAVMELAKGVQVVMEVANGIVKQLAEIVVEVLHVLETVKVVAEDVLVVVLVQGQLDHMEVLEMEEILVIVALELVTTDAKQDALADVVIVVVQIVGVVVQEDVKVVLEDAQEDVRVIVHLVALALVLEDVQAAKDAQEIVHHVQEIVQEDAIQLVLHAQEVA